MQCDSMQVNHMLVALGKEDGKGGRGEGRRVGGYDNTGKKM